MSIFHNFFGTANFSKEKGRLEILKTLSKQGNDLKPFQILKIIKSVFFTAISDLENNKERVFLQFQGT